MSDDSWHPPSGEEIKAKSAAMRAQSRDLAQLADDEMAIFQDHLPPSLVKDFRRVRAKRRRELELAGDMKAQWNEAAHKFILMKFIHESAEAKQKRHKEIKADRLRRTPLDGVADMAGYLERWQARLRAVGPTAAGLSRSELWKQVDALVDGTADALFLISAHLELHPNVEMRPLGELADNAAASLLVLKEFSEHRFFG